MTYHHVDEVRDTWHAAQPREPEREHTVTICAACPDGPGRVIARDVQEFLNAKVMEALDAALELLASNGIHGGLPDGYCAPCEGHCLRTVQAEPPAVPGQITVDEVLVCRD